MKQLPTYTEQFNKITEAYIKGEIKPFNGNFCFCGTLNNNDKSWVKPQSWLTYSNDEFSKMEKALYSGLTEIGLQILRPYESSVCTCIYNWQGLERHPEYETALFNGMCAALEVLKQIHIERGEVIDQEPVFKKRILTTV